MVDKGSNPENWQETFSSSMYTYMLSRGVQRGYIPKDYHGVAEKSYEQSADSTGTPRTLLIRE